MVPRICILQGQRWITSLLYRNLFMYFKLVLSWDWSIVLLEKTFQGIKMTTTLPFGASVVYISKNY